MTEPQPEMSLDLDTKLNHASEKGSDYLDSLLEDVEVDEEAAAENEEDLDADSSHETSDEDNPETQTEAEAEEPRETPAEHRARRYADQESLSTLTVEDLQRALERMDANRAEREALLVELNGFDENSTSDTAAAEKLEIQGAIDELDDEFEKLHEQRSSVERVLDRMRARQPEGQEENPEDASSGAGGSGDGTETPSSAPEGASEKPCSSGNNSKRERGNFRQHACRS